MSEQPVRRGNGPTRLVENVDRGWIGAVGAFLVRAIPLALLK